jgi:hypothetical protein
LSLKTTNLPFFNKLKRHNSGLESPAINKDRLLFNFKRTVQMSMKTTKLPLKKTSGITLDAYKE